MSRVPRPKPPSTNPRAPQARGRDGVRSAPPDERAALTAALAALLVAATSLFAGFVWDDRWLILQSPVREHPELLFRLLVERHGWGSMLADVGSPEDGGYWRPLATLIHSLLLVAFGPRAPLFHALGALAQAATVWLLTRWLSLRLPSAAALVGGLLFALHPALVDAWAWNSALPDLLAAVGALACLQAAERDGRGAGVVAGVSALGALLAKESGGVLVPWLGLLALARWVPPKRLVAPALGLLAYLVLRAASVGLASGAVERPPGVTAPMPVLAGQLFLADLSRLLLPWPVTLEPAAWAQAAGHAALGGVGLAILAAGCLAVLVCLYRARAAGSGPAVVGFGMLLSGLLPTLQFLPTSDVFGGRFLYLPAIGLAMLAAAAFAAAERRARPVRARALVGVAAALLLLGAAGSVRRALDWRSDQSLFAAEQARRPDSARALVLWAGHLMNDGRNAEAEPVVASAERLVPGHPRVRFLRALLDLNRGRAAEAEAVFRDLAEHWRASPTLLANLANAQIRLGRYEEGLTTLERATRGSTPTPGMRSDRGIALWRMGQAEEAERQFRAAIEQAPDYLPAQVNLISLLASEAESDEPRRSEAIARADRFLAEHPESAFARTVRELRERLAADGR